MATDPRLAVLARQLAARLSMDRSLGVEYAGLDRLPAAELEAYVSSLATSHTPPLAPDTDTATASGSDTTPPAETPRPPSMQDPVAPVEDTGTAATLDALRPTRDAALGCTLCRLCETRNAVVFGEGDVDSDLVFVGEAPGREEDEQGRPFVGRAGRLLSRMIEGALRRPRSSVYICNILKCRPPGNRDPRPDEIATCTPYLKAQLAAIRPKVIVALGRFAGAFLAGEDLPMGRLRGQWWEYEGVPVRAIYHPAYLLRQRDAEGRGNPADRKTLDDLNAITESLRTG